MEDVVILGAGPAGMTAALYLLRAGRTPVLLEGGVCGGQLAVTAQVENFPGFPGGPGWELAEQMRRQLERLGLQPRLEQAVGVTARPGGFAVATGTQTLACRAVILANGVRRRRLGCPGEAELAGRGVCWCAVCDGPLYRGRAAAVIGGGSSALEEAVYLAGLCSQVWLVYRGDRLRGQQTLQEAVGRCANVRQLPGWQVQEILGRDAVTGLRLQSSAGETQTLCVSAVFEAIGLEPDNGAFSPPYPLDEAGYVLAGEDCRTAIPGLYAAGDTRRKTLRQLITASADGAQAAASVLQDLGGA